MYSSDVSNPVKQVYSTEKLAHEFTAAPDADGPTVIVVPTQPQQAHLG
jgi:benzoylformate decarboxylase